MTGERILVVEDNEKNMKLFRDVLSATGYRTLEATTGGEAVELATEQAPDLVLMDIQMPGRRRRRGASPAARRRAHGRHPGARGDRAGDAGRPRAFPGGGFDGYLSKPVNVRELIGTVQQHCDGRAG